MNINQIRKEVLEMMDQKYGSSTVLLSKVNDRQIEEMNFMRVKDAQAIRECCRRNQLQVSFREAGKNTIDRIKQGNPCKGHDIMDKSIKEVGGRWTYNTNENLDQLKGLIGYSNSEGQLGGVWVLEDGKSMKKDLGDRSAIKFNDAFTGDYDMHDLIKKGNRIVAATPDEHSAIDQLNGSILRKNIEGVSDHQNPDMKRERLVNGTGKRSYLSPYSLIRHGAQTSFMCYMLSTDGRTDLNEAMKESLQCELLPAEDKVLKIDGNILMFDEFGEAYLLDSVRHIYHYYKNKNLLMQVPFYYFFHDLRRIDSNKVHLEKYTEYINTICLAKIRG